MRRTGEPYLKRDSTFIDYAIHNIRDIMNIEPEVDGRCIKIPCPCKICVNHLVLMSEEVKLHLFSNGIHEDYTNCNKHGENDDPSKSSPKPVNARNEFGDNPDFSSEILTDGPHKRKCL